MAKIKFDVSNVEDGGDFTQAKPGMYIAKIAEVNEKESSKGNPMLEIIFEITRDSKGKKVKERYSRIWHYVITDPESGAFFRMKELVKALGLKLKGTLDTDKIVGTELQIQVKADKDLEDNYRAKIGKVLALPEDEDDEDEDDEDDDDDIEDEDDESEDDDDDDEEAYTEEDLDELDNDELKEVAEEFDLDIPKRLTDKGRAKLIDAILEAQEEGEEDDEDDEEEDDDESDYDSMSRKELIAEIKERGLKAPRGAEEGDLIAILEEDDDSEGDDDEDDDDDDEDAEDYSEWDLDAIKNELKERGLKVGGSKKIMIARLEKDDESEEDPF